MSISLPSYMAVVKSSQEVSAAPQPFSSEKKSMSLGDLHSSRDTGSGIPAPVSEGLLYQQAQEKKVLWQQYWEKQGFPQRRKSS